MDNPLDMIGQLAKNIGTASKDLIDNSQQAVVAALDENGNGQIDIEDIIIKALRVPWIKVNRATFLKSELKMIASDDLIDTAIKMSPSVAGISLSAIDKIAAEVIRADTIAASGIAAALGAPGGAAMAATIPADIIQYYGWLIVDLQKLLYLYGFPEIVIGSGESVLDSATLNVVTMCMGVMYGVNGARNGINVLAKGLAAGVEKQLVNKALTKGTLYPVVKQVAKWFNVKMTKQLFAGFFKNSIPLVGAAIGGGLTFFTFEPCCKRLRDALKDTALADPTKNDGDVSFFYKDDDVTIH